MHLKNLYALALSLLVALTGYAQEQTPDSVVALHEVVVKGAEVSRRVDRDLYRPTQQARSLSSNGLQLLFNMHIPGLTVDQALNTIKAPTGDVVVYINGRKATAQEALALLPSSIVRVEYHTDPGLRYGGAAAVIDFIVRNPTAGGSLQAVVSPWWQNFPTGDGTADVKLNRGHGEWGAHVYTQLRHHLDMQRDYDETFRMPDGTILHRVEEPRGGHHDTYLVMGNTHYSYVRPDTTVFWASIGLNHDNPNYMGFKGRMQVDGQPDVYLETQNQEPYNTPMLNLYLERNIGRGQTLIFDLVGSLSLRRNKSVYDERYEPAGEPFTDITNDIKDRNWYGGFEADYRRRWDKSVVSAGTSYKLWRNRSTYLSSQGRVYHQRQDRWYAFAEYTHKFGAFSVTPGASVQYDDTRLREAGRGTNGWKVLPQLRMSWRQGPSMLKASVQRWNENPTLAQTNPVTQQIDAVRWQEGNPSLRGYAMWNARLQWSYYHERVNGSVIANYQWCGRDGIGEVINWQPDGRLLTTYANNCRNRSFWIGVFPTVTIVPDWLIVTGGLRLRRFFSDGPNYNHTLTNWGYQADVVVMHWGAQFFLQYSRANEKLTGETSYRGESSNVVGLSYNWRRWQFMAYMVCPFGNYSQRWRQYNADYSYSQSLRVPWIERMMAFRVTYTLQWGHRRKADVKKSVDASGEEMSSSAAKR